MTRTFIALEMNEDVQHHLAELIRRMAQDLHNLRWVDPSSIHLTLAFLGELDDEQLPAAYFCAIMLHPSMARRSICANPFPMGDTSIYSSSVWARPA